MSVYVSVCQCMSVYVSVRSIYHSSCHDAINNITQHVVRRNVPAKELFTVAVSSQVSSISDSTPIIGAHTTSNMGRTYASEERDSVRTNTEVFLEA